MNSDQKQALGYDLMYLFTREVFIGIKKEILIRRFGPIMSLFLFIWGFSGEEIEKQHKIWISYTKAGNEPEPGKIIERLITTLEGDRDGHDRLIIQLVAIADMTSSPEKTRDLLNHFANQFYMTIPQRTDCVKRGLELSVIIQQIGESYYKEEYK